MSKSSSRTANTVNKGSRVHRMFIQELLPLLVPDFKAAIENGINEQLSDLKRVFLECLMHAEVNQKIGPPYARSSGNTKRWGYEKGIAIADAGRIEVTRPRLRVLRQLGEGEVHLETYKAMNRSDLMDGPLTLAILGGVSSRAYADIVCRNLRAKGIKKSTISRRAIVASKSVVDAFLKRDLSGLDLVVLFLDGVHVAGKNAITCMGMDLHGRKHVLGIQLGPNESEIVCRDLLRDLFDRGLNSELPYLFVIDGSRGIAAALRAAFGPNAFIQRCQEHKIRDVQGYLPFKHRQEFRGKMQAAYAQKSERSALNRLQKIRCELGSISEKAMKSFTEGLYETLTVNRLGVTGVLKKSVRTTNVIESAFSSVRRYMGRVKLFRDEKQRDRWLIWSLIEAEKHFRPVEGSRQIPELRKALMRASQKMQKTI